VCREKKTGRSGVSQGIQKSRLGLCCCLLLLALSMATMPGPRAFADNLDPGSGIEAETAADRSPWLSRSASADGAAVMSAVWHALSTPPEPCLDMQAYIGGTGLRSLYCAIRGVFNVADLEAMAGMPAFLSSPHIGGELHLHEDSFGHYNPSMVRWVETNLLPDPWDTDFILNTQWIYDTTMRQMARAFHRTFVQLSDNLWHFDQERRYLMEMIAGERPWSYMGARFQEDTLRSVLDLDIRAEGLNWYHVDTAIRYWQRRSIDGSADDVFRALESLLSLYDFDFLANAPRPAGTVPYLPPPGAAITQPLTPGKPMLPEPR